MKSALEGRMGEEVKPDHPGLPWIVMHSANLLNRCQKGKDGCTAYRRVKGKDFEGMAIEFGEEVWHMKPGIVGNDKMGVRWHSGIWLGTR